MLIIILRKPPTAVIAPIVKPTAPVKQKSTDSSKKNELKTRQRSVSDAPVPKKTEPKDIAVSYNAAGDNVNVPVTAQLEKTRSHSDNTHSSDIGKSSHFHRFKMVFVLSQCNDLKKLIHHVTLC